MITTKAGEAAVPDIESWAERIARQEDNATGASVYYDAESNTYVLRLAQTNRVLLFRLSETQVQSVRREAQCEKILRRKIRDLRERI